MGLGAVLLAGYAGYLYIHPEQSGRERQNTEESLAQAYIEALLEKETENEGSLVSESTFEETSEDTEELSLEEESTEVRSSDAEEPTLETKWDELHHFLRKKRISLQRYCCRRNASLHRGFKNLCKRSVLLQV